MRIAAGIEYDGTNYHGWQKQTFASLPTIQETIEHAISKVSNHPVDIVTAGRTDAGVHATEQVIHIDTTAIRTERAWVLGTNTHLPKDIVIKWVRFVSDDFHARFSAIARRYQYLIFNSPQRSALMHHRSALVYEALNAEAMHKAVQYLIGEHDFSTFRAAECQAKSPVRTIDYFKVERIGSFIYCEVQANAFLHHMVRNMVGSLIKVGKGEQSPEWMQEILHKCDRRQAGMTAPACGLYLVKVIYN